MQKIINIFIHGTLLPKTILQIRPLHVFFHCPSGLIKADTLNQKLHLASLTHALSNGFKGDYYVFGWSGKLNPLERKLAAADLYKSLQEIATPDTFIRLISHSHGGNVALHTKDLSDGSFAIDELILLACPVQKETAQNVTHRFFKKVYSIHSHYDLIQVIDPQGIYHLVNMELIPSTTADQFNHT